MTAPLLSVMDNISSAEAIAGLVGLLYPDASTALDCTYGSGRFWTPDTALKVTGLDRNPARARAVCGDFTALPFADDSFDLAVFDPPYMCEMSPKAIMGGHFGSFASIGALEAAVRAGAAEAWRVARVGVIVKAQNHVHQSRFLHLTRWVEESIPSPVFDELHVTRRKLIDSKWGDQLSVYRNHASYLCFRKGRQTHKRRTA